MATVVLVPDVLTDAGLAPTRNAGLSIANTYKVRNNGKTFLHFRKSGANACTVTLVGQGTLRGKALAALTVNVPANTGDVMIGPFPADVYNDTNHDVSFTLSEVTGLDVAVVAIPGPSA
jgi:hypothetical protein